MCCCAFDRISFVLKSFIKYVFKKRAIACKNSNIVLNGIKTMTKTHEMTKKNHTIHVNNSESH